ncbi:oligopeptide transporter, OPT family [candidate division KSB1 bacterium]|nr:oligopeptide transporter, OPT family [candidate division KSB1 bacterium]
METEKPIQLPKNAFTELKPGETYTPIITAERGVAELTLRSVVFGLLMAVLFSGAAAYIALKLGQGIETAIPIAILAVGYSAMLARKSTLIENVNILAIGATSGIIVGGSVFVMPAIYILGVEHLSSFFQICLVPLFGAVLGALFLIPFRRYFVADQHGKLPFPEATATTEVLVTGERGGKQAKVLVYAMAIGGLFDFIGPSMHAWAENFTTSLIGALSTLTHKIKAVFSLNTSAAICGLGYLIGVRYAAIILAGSMMSWFVLVPLFAHLGGFIQGPISPDLQPLSKMSAEDIFYNYARYVGIGGIFAAGLISILKMSSVIVKALRQAFGEIFRSRGKESGEPAELTRTDRDIRMATVFGWILGVSFLLWIYFRFVVLVGQTNPTALSLVSILITLVIAFLFASVSAWAVAMISVTPISGMTLMTLIISAVLLSQLGLGGPGGMLATLLIGGVVCTALSMTATLVTEFKIGYWLGATPRTIQWSNILAAVVSSVTVTAVIILLAKVYGFSPSAVHPQPMPAPQANAMAAVLSSLMGGGQAPWFLYGLGVVFAVIVEMVGVSGLAFALGMYLPIELNSPILMGAIVAWLVKKSSSEEGTSKARHDKGLLIASGLIAGGAIIGVVSALLKFIEDKYRLVIVPDLANTGPWGNWLGLAMFLGLCVYIYWDSCRAKGNN